MIAFPCVGEIGMFAMLFGNVIVSWSASWFANLCANWFAIWFGNVIVSWYYLPAGLLIGVLVGFTNSWRAGGDAGTKRNAV